jgi:hypothetical protein
VRTLVVSDLHLGSRTDADVLRRQDARDALAAAVDGADRLVLLGDTLELRHGPVAAAIATAAPTFAAIGDALRPGAEVVLVAGNHDHALVAPWLERRALDGDPGLGLSASGGPDASEAVAQVAELLRPARLRVAYPGLWLREDVYALHGHYLDRHITIPTFERIASGFMARVAGHVPDHGATATDYEAALAPLYAWLHVVARHTTTSFGAERQRSSQNAWALLTAQGPRPLRARLLAAGFPWAVRALNVAGAGPLRADLSGAELRRAGLRAMHEVVGRLGIGARWVLFGHTHRAGPLPHDDAAEWGGLVNSGSWVHEATFLGADPTKSPYFPGTYVEVDGTPGTPPLVRNALRESGERHRA